MSVIFPKWMNQLPALVAAGVLTGGVVAVSAVWYWFSPEFTDVGYSPDQPVLYSHKLHAGLMGMDCRYCHTSVEVGPHATVPPTETCMNCHKGVLTESDQIVELTAAHEAGQPLPWQKVHLLPDYAFFDHSAHLHAGVGCTSCHGRIDQMEVVRQVEPLSMSWCLDCHRDPTEHLRPSDVAPTDMAWMPDDSSIAFARTRIESGEIVPPQHCSACHR